MKKMMVVLATIAVLLFSGVAFAGPVTDTVQFNTGFFTPDEASTYEDPYYRWYNQDWGWEHNAISGTFTSASLNISAWDVDAPAEVDVISVYDYSLGSYANLGALEGLNNAWGYTTFDVTAYLDDISQGLKVFMDIDSTHDREFWAVSLAKSSLSLDGGAIPNPNPNPVPEPSTLLLLGIGIAGLAFYRRKSA